MPEALRATTNRIICEVLPRETREGSTYLPKSRATHHMATRGEVMWAKVVSVGPEVKDVAPGMVVALDPSHSEVETFKWNGTDMVSVHERYWRFADASNSGALFGVVRVSD